MRSNFERNKFRRIYAIASVVFLLVLTGIGYGMEGRLTWTAAAMLTAAVVFLLVLYGLVSHMLFSAYEDIEHISELMSDVTDKDTNPPPEEYKEGTMGILYSNFYKLLYLLKDSQMREREEKVFLKDIISDISHQLKTPLSSLNVFIDLLLEDRVEDEGKRRQLLQEAQNQLSRMEWMVLSMLKLARIEAGAVPFDRRNTPLYPLLAEAAQGVRYLTEKRKQSIVIECAENCMLLCDGDWLLEALINLLKNASDYSGTGQTIRLEVEQTSMYTSIYVKDEGIGIPEREIPNIFKRFYRVNQEVNPASVGIGLSLTKSIIEGMQGNIRVKSEEGKYTWFILSFVN